MTVTKKPAAAKKPAAKKPAAKKPAAKKPVAEKAAAKSASAPKKMAPRADFGAPIDAFFAKQPAATRPVAEALRALVEAAAPKATASLKWGMPVYELNGKMLCAIGGHKAHVNLILAGPPGTFDDPAGLLIGEGKTGKHLKLTALAELPNTQVKSWLKTAVARLS